MSVSIYELYMLNDIDISPDHGPPNEEELGTIHGPYIAKFFELMTSISQEELSIGM